MNSVTGKTVQIHQRNNNNHNPPPQQQQPQHQQQQPRRDINNFNQNGNSLVNYRRTSAEIVSEAKTLLAGGGGGARLVSTRRPITPREPRRQLYGKQAPPGRPPSAFSLRYLQFESRALPSIQPIHQQQLHHSSLDDIPIVQRSGSIGTLLDYVGANNTVSNGNNNNNNNNSNNSSNTNHVRLQGKLPALLSPPKITASLDNLSEEMPPHPDLMQKAYLEDDNNNNKNIEEGNGENGPSDDTNDTIKAEVETTTTNEKKPPPSSRSGSGKQQHLLKSRQTKSFDTPLPPSEVQLKEKSKTKLDMVSNKKRDGLLGNSTSGGSGSLFVSKTRLNRSNDLLAQSTTETLLDLLKAHSGIKECTEETVQHINAILVELYTRVKGAKGNWRGAILGGLYGLVECTSSKILLAVARVVLALCVTGSNLTGACKLVFKVARNEINDHLFADSDVPELLIDGLGRASPLDEPEACIYGYGAVRFLASASQLANVTTAATLNSSIGKIGGTQITNKQKSIAQRLARHGAVQLMVLHLQILNEAGAVQKLIGPPLHALYQLAAALRALAGIPQVIGNASNATRSLLTSSQEASGSFPTIKETKEIQKIHLELACPHLVKAAEIAIGESEVQANIVRTLSVLSEHEPCCEALSELSARIGMLLGPCSDVSNGVPEKPLTLLSRLGYILGNIMARFDTSRTQFYNNDVAMEYLLEALELYSNQKLTMHNQLGDTVIDVLIKLVRVVANMSVNHDVGLGLGTKSRLGEVLLRLLLTANSAKGTKMTPEMEELLQATLGALHNLCFYHDSIEEQPENNDHDGSMCERIPDFTVALCTTLNSGPELARPEAARVLGNMTRNQLARNSFCTAGGLKVIVRCLGSDDYELAATSSGVLVNLLGDWERRAPFRELKGPLILRDVLQKSAMQEDWLLAGIVCQALWNYLIDSGNVIGALGEDEADYIAGDLAEYLDEERIFNGQAPDVIWEQFAVVATDLLERIQSSMSIGNSPCCSTDEENGGIDADEMPIGEIGDKWRGNFKNWLAE